MTITRTDKLIKDANDIMNEDTENGKAGQINFFTPGNTDSILNQIQDKYDEFGNNREDIIPYKFTRYSNDTSILKFNQNPSDNASKDKNTNQIEDRLINDIEN